MSEAPTQAEVMKVRRHECAANGHSITTVSSPSSGITSIFCDRCGESWKVVGKMDVLKARGCPSCPECKEPLIARDATRRFQEDDRYVECVNGHVWGLELPYPEEDDKAPPEPSI